MRDDVRLPVERVVVEVELRIEREEPAVRRDDERIDLDQRAIARDEELEHRAEELARLRDHVPFRPSAAASLRVWYGCRPSVG